MNADNKSFKAWIRTLACAMVVMMTLEAAMAEQDAVSVGAIRWDAWTGGNITEQVERSLGPKKYHNRLPWFAQVKEGGGVTIDGSPQSVMDREIAFAADAGLDYWAFLIYPEHSTMSVALGQYLASEHRQRVGFCMILHSSLKVSEERWPAERERVIQLMQEDGYQTVLDGRPLVYGFTGAEFPAERFQNLVEVARERGLNPYYVFMGWNPPADFEKATKIGFHAVSAYARGGDMPTFNELVQDVESRNWQRAKKARAEYVPLVTTGWDKYPRQDNPVSWEKDSAYHSQKVFPATAKPNEIADHLARAIGFVHENPSLCPAQTIIAYAWNEYDEGGWLAPTRGEDGQPDTSRLDAVRQVLEKVRTSAKASSVSPAKE